MKREEAETYVMMMAAATSTRLLNDEKVVWEEYLLPLDADITYRTVMSGRRTWARFPSWKLFKEVYNSERNLSEPVGEQRSSTTSESKYGTEPPEWAFVWHWCRTMRKPRNLIPFPQQTGWVDEATMLTLDEYEALRREWEQAGKPKAENLIPVLR